MDLDVSGLYLPSPLAVDLCPVAQIENVRETRQLTVSIRSVSSQHTATFQQVSFTPAKHFLLQDYQVFDRTDHNNLF